MAPPTTPKTPSKGSKIISKQSKATRTASKAGASAERKAPKRKRKSKSIIFQRLLKKKRFVSGKETYSIYIYKVLKQVNILLNKSIKSNIYFIRFILIQVFPVKQCR